MKKEKKIVIVVSAIVVLWALSQTWGVAQLSGNALDKLRPKDNAAAVLVKGKQPWASSDLPQEWYSRSGVAILPCFVACDVAYEKDHIGNAVRKYHFWLLGLSVELSSKYIWQKR